MKLSDAPCRVGAGDDCIRILPRRQGCELRYRGRVLFANSHLTLVLEYVLRDPQGLRVNDFADSIGIAPEAALATVRRTLRSLHEAAVPLSAFGSYWQSIAGGVDERL